MVRYLSRHPPTEHCRLRLSGHGDPCVDLFVRNRHRAELGRSRLRQLQQDDVVCVGVGVIFRVRMDSGDSVQPAAGGPSVRAHPDGGRIRVEVTGVVAVVEAVRRGHDPIARNQRAAAQGKGIIDRIDGDRPPVLVRIRGLAPDDPGGRMELCGRVSGQRRQEEKQHPDNTRLHLHVPHGVALIGTGLRPVCSSVARRGGFEYHKRCFTSRLEACSRHGAPDRRGVRRAGRLPVPAGNAGEACEGRLPERRCLEK